MDKVVILGGQEQSGVYLLRMVVNQPIRVALGRFCGGRPLTFPAGDYLYVGSALAEHGSTTLAHRLLRHATRSDALPAHPIRAEMLQCFVAVGLGSAGLTPPTGKRCFWNVDFLLNHLAVELTQIYTMRTRCCLEPMIAHMLLADKHTYLVAKGLGARDHPGSTHLLGVQAPVTWWVELSSRLALLLYCG
jgi:Uri superfamily endonuclease